MVIQLYVYKELSVRPNVRSLVDNNSESARKNGANFSKKDIKVKFMVEFPISNIINQWLNKKKNRFRNINKMC